MVRDECTETHDVDRVGCQLGSVKMVDEAQGQVAG